MVGKPALGAKLDENDDNLSFYLSLEEATRAIEKHTASTNTSFAQIRSDSSFGKRKWKNEDFKIKWWEGETSEGESLSFDGIPFLLLGTRHLGCEYSSEKERKISKFENKKNLECNTIKENRDPCPAKIILKEVLKFPDYKIESYNRRDMLRTSQVLRNDLKSSAAVMQPRIYVEFPKPESHHHPPIKKISRVSLKPSKSCLVCNANFSSSTRASVAIFDEWARTSHRQLEVHAVLGEVLKQELEMQNLHSTTICSRCFNLLDDIDALEEQLANKKEMMCERYSRTTKLILGNTEASDISGDEAVDDVDDGDSLYGKRPLVKPARKGRPVGRPKGRGPGRTSGKSKSAILQKVPAKLKDSSDLQKSAGKVDTSPFKNMTAPHKISVKNCDLLLEELPKECVVKIEADEEQELHLHDTNATNKNFIKKEILSDDLELPAEVLEEKPIIVALVENDDMADQISVELKGDVLEVVEEVLEQEKEESKRQSRTYSCSECSKKFKSKAAVRNHVKTHSHEVSFDCKDCSKVFFNKYRYKAHVKIHEHREKSHTCEVCNKSYYTTYQLKSHMKIHSDSNQFLCTICGKSLSTQKTLDIHALTHSGEKPFQCEHCGAIFRQRSNLYTHIKSTHFREKKFACQLCQKTFARKRLLEYHMNSVHTGQRPYKCELCDTTFVYPHYYKRHLRKHNGEKPFKCHVCSKQFSSRENRNAHLFIHSNKRPYECKICGAGFMRKPLCVSHVACHAYQGLPDENIIFNSPRLMVNAPPGQIGQENIISTEDEVERAVETVRMVESTVTEASDEFYTVRDDKVLKVMSRPVHIIESEDRTRYVIHTGDRRDENMEHFLAALQGQVVEVQTEDF
ncbi:hypothetical protein SK128_006830 [Halocaridina rubra]|uniref:Uncharacterized protein n=1 Tax=Halocaridina rubra TaxID=373956 RepID=A0AAN8WN21_HALRR